MVSSNWSRLFCWATSESAGATSFTMCWTFSEAGTEVMESNMCSLSYKAFSSAAFIFEIESLTATSSSSLCSLVSVTAAIVFAFDSDANTFAIPTATAASSSSALSCMTANFSSLISCRIRASFSL